MPDDLVGGGLPPHDPAMESRVLALESGLTRFDTKLVHIGDRMQSLGMTVDQVDRRLQTVEVKLDHLDIRMGSIESKFDSFDGRIRAVETSIAALDGKLTILIETVIGRLPSWWQMPAVILGTTTVLAAMLAFAQRLHLFTL